MMAVASAWRGLAAEMTSAVTSYETTISQLVDDEWMGPASVAMAAAAAPYAGILERFGGSGCWRCRSG